MTRLSPARVGRSQGLVRTLACFFVVGLLVCYGAILAGLWGVDVGGLLVWTIVGLVLLLLGLSACVAGWSPRKGHSER